MLSENGFANRGEKRIKEVLMFVQQVSELRRKDGNQSSMHLTLGCRNFGDLDIWAEAVSLFIEIAVSL